LNQDSEFSQDQDVAQRITAASAQCEAEMRSENSWVIEVPVPLLNAAIGKLPLKYWSVYVLAMI